MSLLDRLKSWIGPELPRAEAPSTREGPPGDREELLDALRLVIDPELGIDVVSMGLIRRIALEGEVARVEMTLSTPGCPVGPMLVSEVEEAARRCGLRPDLTLSFDPPWSPDDISPQARDRVR
jgi:metal-sulfur cluster biosynthetic enzyme